MAEEPADIGTRRLRIAFGIYRLAPRGGLEDQCIRLAEELAARGHAVTVFCAVPGGPMPVAVEVLAGPARPLTNHGRMARFAALFRDATRQGFDRTVVFQPIPGADILFCADMPRHRGHVPLLKRLSPRFRTFRALEEGCFGAGARTRIICLAEPQAAGYQAAHGTPADRLALMPPSIDIGRRKPERRDPANRKRVRSALQLAPGEPTWLWLGLQPMVKGLDRVVDALAGVAEARLLVVGLSKDDPKAAKIVAQARERSVADRIAWLGYQGGDDLLDIMAAADALAHPARTDVTGAVILEALVNGLPVVTGANCGFAVHVERSGAGVVINADFSAAAFAEALRVATGPRGPSMSESGIAYGRSQNLYSGLSVAARMVEADDWAGSGWLVAGAG